MIASLDQASRDLFRLGRAFGRLPRHELVGSSGTVPELSAILVVQAVEDVQATGAEVTIGDVASLLGVDPSTASRLVAHTVAAGYLRRTAARSDRRATALVLTEEGHALCAGASCYQRAVFDAATAGWTDAERETFARLFTRFADSIITALHAQERKES